MNDVLLRVELRDWMLVVTPWKLIGYGGVVVFTGRWLVQVIASHQERRSHFPRLFWYMSLLGSLLLLSYFSLSDKSDSVGVLSNLFPVAIAGYNLFLEAQHDGRRAGLGESKTGVSRPRDEVGPVDEMPPEPSASDPRRRVAGSAR